MTTDKLNVSTINGTKISEQADVAYRPVNRAIVFMRKLGTGDLESEYEFKPPAEEVVMHTVMLKQVILAPDADHNELCMLELETKIDTGSTETFPLAYLGPNRLQVPLEVRLLDKAVIRLTKGKGPVFLIGEYAEEWRDDEDIEADESCHETEEADVEEDGVGDVEGENKENAVVNGIRKRKLDETEDVSVKKRKEDAAEPMEEPESETAAK